MTVQEAQASIGKKFKIDDPIFSRWTDSIKEVDNRGNVHGYILTAHCSHCRFVNPQPEHLKKKNDNSAQALSQQEINEMNQDEHQRYSNHKLI